MAFTHTARLSVILAEEPLCPNVSSRARATAGKLMERRLVRTWKRLTRVLAVRSHVRGGSILPEDFVLLTAANAARRRSVMPA